MKCYNLKVRTMNGIHAVCIFIGCIMVMDDEASGSNIAGLLAGLPVAWEH